MSKITQTMALPADGSYTRYLTGFPGRWCGTVHEVFLSGLAKAYVVEVPGEDPESPNIIGSFVDDEVAAVDALQAYVEAHPR